MALWLLITSLFGETVELDNPDMTMEPFAGTTDDRMKVLWNMVANADCGGSVGIPLLSVRESNGFTVSRY